MNIQDERRNFVWQFLLWEWGLLIRHHAYVAKSRSGHVCRASVVIHEKPDHKYVVADAQFKALYVFWL